MQKEEIKKGALVCLCVDGKPFVNTTVLEYPRRGSNGDEFAMVAGVEHEVRIKDLRPFYRGYTNCDDLLTSEEWHKREFALYKILEPDGWDKSNFQYSWFIERINETEFTTRLSASKVQPVKIFGQ